MESNRRRRTERRRSHRHFAVLGWTEAHQVCLSSPGKGATPPPPSEVVGSSATADDKYGDELADVSLHASPTPFNRVLSTKPTKSLSIHASLEPIQQVPSTKYSGSIYGDPITPLLVHLRQKYDEKQNGAAFLNLSATFSPNRLDSTLPYHGRLDSSI